MALVASQTVIDLLSSDDETPIASRTSKSKAAATSSRLPPETLPSYILLDSQDAENRDWSENAPKRRRLSGSPPHKPAVTTKQPTESLVCHKRNISDLSDEIIFTSSAGASRHKSRCNDQRRYDTLREDSDDLPDDIFSLGNGEIAPQLSHKTTAFLAKIKDNRISAPKRNPGLSKAAKIQRRTGTVSISPTATQGSIISEDEGQGIKQPRPKSAKQPKLTEEEKALKAQEKEAIKHAKALEKAKDKGVEKERKRIEREEKAREKQRAADLAEVNKAKKDRKETCKEMTVDLPISIEGSRVDDQIKEFLKKLEIAATSFQSAVPNVICWRRKVDSVFDEAQGHRVAIPKEIQDEKHALCLMSAKEFVDLATAKDNPLERDTLDHHIRKLKSGFANCSIIYLIEGLEPWMRKNKNARNRAYQAAVLGQAQNADDGLPAPGQQHYRRKKQPEVLIDEDLIEDALLQLQVIEGCLVHHTATPFESAEWVANFTQHISQIPYREDRLRLDTSFCMDSGQVKTGEDKDDTYIKMLQEVKMITVSMAHGIAAKYPDVRGLLKGFKELGPLALEHVRKSANKDGALSDRRIGPAASRRLYAIFMGTDPTTTDV